MNEKENKKTEPEMVILTILFICLCAALIVSIFVPNVSDLCDMCYALIAIIGVITCARTKDFLAVDSLINVYPKGAKSVVKTIRDVIMLVIFALLFVAAIVGVVHEISAPTFTEVMGIPMIILYIVPIVVYPISLFFYIQAMRKKKEEDK